MLYAYVELSDPEQSSLDDRTSSQFLRPASPIPPSVAKLSFDAELVCSQNLPLPGIFLPYCFSFFFYKYHLFLQMVPVWLQSRQQPAICLLPRSIRLVKHPMSLSLPLQVNFRSSLKSKKKKYAARNTLLPFKREDISFVSEKFEKSNFHPFKFLLVILETSNNFFSWKLLFYSFPDNSMRFWRCTPSSSGSNKYEWREWNMISDNKPSELDVDGRRFFLFLLLLDFDHLKQFIARISSQNFVLHWSSSMNFAEFLRVVHLQAKSIRSRPPTAVELPVPTTLRWRAVCRLIRRSANLKAFLPRNY